MGKYAWALSWWLRGKKGTLSCCFHPNDVEGWKVIESPHHKIIAHHQPGRGSGEGRWVLHNQYDEGDRKGAEIKAEIKSLDEKLTPKTPLPNFQALKIPQWIKWYNKKKTKEVEGLWLFIYCTIWTFPHLVFYNYETAYVRGIAMYCYTNLQIILRFSRPKTFLLKSRHPPPELKIFATQKVLELKISSTQSIPPGPSEALHRLFSSTKDTCAKLLKTHRAM